VFWIASISLERNKQHDSAAGRISVERAEIAAVGDDLSAERGEVLQTVSDKAELPISAGPGDGRYATVEVARSIERAVTLASIYLDRSTIREIIERNRNLTVLLLQEFPWSHHCVEEGRIEGHAQGLIEGRQERNGESRVETLLTVARVRHGQLNERLVAAVASSLQGLEELTEMILNSPNKLELDHLLENKARIISTSEGIA
jgi:hypothetical protein